MPCTCNEPNQTKTLTCFNMNICTKTWSEPKHHFEIVSSCPEHRSSIAICGTTPSLCNDCKANGYSLQFAGGFLLYMKLFIMIIFNYIFY